MFSKQNKIEKQQIEQKLCEKKDDKPLSLGTADSKPTKLIEKKKVNKSKKKVEVKTLEKKMIKEVIETVYLTENNETASFKRNLRPRRSSTMLDDYIIMTDSDEDDMKCEPVIQVTKCEPPKSSTKTTTVAEESKSQKCKLSTDESIKKNLKINKTDLKPKKDLNKDSEVKKSLSETKSKSIILKRDKELEIKNNKNTAVDKKNERSSKNKTELVGITDEPKTTGIGSKNARKKVPPPKQQSTKKESASNKKKSNLDLYNNNNNNKKKRSISSSSVTSSSSSMFSGITSQTKEELLERMAANFDAKHAVCDEGVEKSADNATLTSAAESNNGPAVKKNAQSNAKEKHVESRVMENSLHNGNVVTGKNTANEVNSVNNELTENKHEVEKVSKTENVIAVPKVENIVTAEKVENVGMTVDKVEKTESIVVPLNKVEKMENMVFQTIAKDLFLGQQKEIKITMPEYFSDKNFQLDNRFKQDDGLSVLSEICSALPRFNEPYVSSRQLLNKMPAPGDSSFVKYVPPAISGGEKLPVQTQTPPPSSDSRCVKIVNLARGNSSPGANEKNNLAASWRRAFKNVKLPKNGIVSSAVSVGNNLVAWTKNKQNDNQTPLPKTYTDGINAGGDNNGDAKQIVSNSNSMKNTLQSSLMNGVTEKKSEPSYNKCQKTCCGESKTIEMTDCKKITPVSVPNNASYLAKTTILNSTKYDLKFEKRSLSAATATTAAPMSLEKQQQIRKDVVGDVSSSDDQSPEKKIFHQRRLSTTQSCSGNSSDAFSPDNETSVYAFQPDLPIPSTPFRRNKPQSPAKSRTVSPNTSIAVSIIWHK